MLSVFFQNLFRIGVSMTIHNSFALVLLLLNLFLQGSALFAGGFKTGAVGKSGDFRNALAFFVFGGICSLTFHISAFTIADAGVFGDPKTSAVMNSTIWYIILTYLVGITLCFTGRCLAEALHGYRAK